MAVDIHQIEDTLADAGVETEYYGDDNRTVYTIANGGQVIEINDAVSGDSFRSEDLTVAYHINAYGDMLNITPSFENVETHDEFITAVNDLFGSIN